jgi:ketosteroid isomerase-like protein
MRGIIGLGFRLGMALTGLGCASLSIGAVAAPSTRPATRNADLDALIAADLAYSRAGAASDLVTAVTAMFDDNVVMVAPGSGFVRGRDKARETLAANPAAAGAKAEWTPASGGISADGQHGFTLGYMRITLADGTKREAKYVAYWTRRPQGWRVALYRRSGKPEGAAPEAGLPPSLPEARGRKAPHAGSREDLLAAERAFSAEAGKSGVGEAFRRFGTPASINTGGGPAFLLGSEAIARNVAAGVGTAKISWAPDDALIAPSGDLGVTWGWIRIEGAPGPIPYFTVWRRHKEGWRYAAE